MNNARYLWKRIPPAIKSANSELGTIWSVGQRIWQRDCPGNYATTDAHQWSETAQPIMEALREAVRSVHLNDRQGLRSFCRAPWGRGCKGCIRRRMAGQLHHKSGCPQKASCRALDVSFSRVAPLSEPAPGAPPSEGQLARLPSILTSPSTSTSTFRVLHPDRYRNVTVFNVLDG